MRLALISVMAGIASAQEASSSTGLPFVVSIPPLAAPVRAEGKNYLAYGLHLMNSGAKRVELHRLEIWGDQQVGALIVRRWRAPSGKQPESPSIQR